MELPQSIGSEVGHVATW